jgi:tRNA A-37 threonylcarbamoyl transferase component Bud32
MSDEIDGAEATMASEAVSEEMAAAQPAGYPDDDPLVGQIFKGAYQINSKIGEGGFGAVYSATQIAVDRPVAVKVLRPDRAKDPRVRDLLVKRFRREAVATSRLAHPNTVRLFDFGETEDGELFLALELLRGRELADAIRDEAPMAPSRVAKIMQGVCMSLAEAHAQKIIHRDLKPANIFLCEVEGDHDFVKVMDFGIARVIEVDQGQSQLTQTGMTQGTPAYMSPEQAMAKETSPATDLYALGCILFEMITGEAVFQEDSALAVSLAHVRDTPAFVVVPGATPEVSNAWNELIQRLLKKKPEQRPQSAKDLAAELDKLSNVTDADGAAAAIASMDITMPKVAAISGDEAGGTPAGGTAAVTAMQTVGAGQTQEGFPIKQGGSPWVAIAASLVLAAGAGWYFMVGPGAATPESNAGALASKTQAPEVEGVKPAAAGAAAPAAALEAERLGSAAAKQAALEAQINKLAAEQAAQSARPKMAKLVLSSSPKGAMVHRGDSLLCTTPCDMEVPVGDPNETLLLKLDGYKEYPLKVSLVHGATVALALNLVKVPSRNRTKRSSGSSSSKSASSAPSPAPAAAKAPVVKKRVLPSLPGFRKTKKKKKLPAMPGFRK